MIFVTVGTHESQFNRLVKAIDDLKASGRLSEEVVVQSGYSDYLPVHCTYRDFYSYEEMDRLVSQARIVITHGGPSSFFAALQKGKTPIVVPRQKEFGEHVNDHQLVFVGQVEERYHNILVIRDVSTLTDTIERFEELSSAAEKSEESRNEEFCRRFRDIASFLEPRWNLRNLPADVQHVFIVGSKGFIQNEEGELLWQLVECYREERKIQYHIICAEEKGTGHIGVPDKAEQLSHTEYLFQQAHCILIKSSDSGMDDGFAYDVRAFRRCLKYIKKNGIASSVIFLMSPGLGYLMRCYKRKLHRLGVTTVYHPSKQDACGDKESVARMVRYSDLVVCDSRRFDEIIRAKFARSKLVTTVIANGIETKAQDLNGKQFRKGIAEKYRNLFLTVGVHQ